MTLLIAVPIWAGDFTTVTPAASSAAILSVWAQKTESLCMQQWITIKCSQTVDKNPLTCCSSLPPADDCARMAHPAAWGAP